MIRSGSLDLEELQKAMRKLHVDMSREEVATLLKTLDKDHDGTVSLGEFKSFFAAVPMVKNLLAASMLCVSSCRALRDLSRRLSQLQMEMTKTACQRK